jgi:antitoxin HicB
MNKQNSSCIGSSLDDFLSEQGVLEETQAEAIKRVISWKLKKAIESKKITVSELARRMKTSRSTVNRVLDPTYTGITLTTLERAATASGMKLKLELVE